MNILIATGIYPPDIGGPAQYAYNLEQQFRKNGHTVNIRYFGNVEKKLPTSLRHLYFLLKTIPAFLKADYILVLDTFSVAFPIYLLSKLSRKPYIIRTGGDFLWESYVERTKRPVLFRKFYQTEIPAFTSKERMIFNVTQKLLKKAKTVVFSTEWQRDIFIPAYNLDQNKTHIIENYYNIHPETLSKNTKTKTFLISTRNLVWKNKELLIRCLKKLQQNFPEHNIKIDDEQYTHTDFVERIKSSYATVLMSLGDISPNMILESIAHGTPFLLTTENGINNRVQNIGLFANPLDEEEVYTKLCALLDPTEYQKLLHGVQNFTHTHTWEDMVREYLQL